MCVCGCVGRGGGHRYVRLCYYSLRVGWRHKKKEKSGGGGGGDERGSGGEGDTADRKRARRLILQFSYITAHPPSLHLHPSLHQFPPSLLLPPFLRAARPVDK